MNHLATLHGASSPAAAELAAAIGPETIAPDVRTLQPLALLVAANQVVTVVLAPLNSGFDSDKWWAQPPL